MCTMNRPKPKPKPAGTSKQIVKPKKGGKKK